MQGWQKVLKNHGNPQLQEVRDIAKEAFKEGWKEAMIKDRSDSKANIKLDKVIYEEIKFQKKATAQMVLNQVLDILSPGSLGFVEIDEEQAITKIKELRDKYNK